MASIATSIVKITSATSDVATDDGFSNFYDQIRDCRAVVHCESLFSDRKITMTILAITIDDQMKVSMISCGILLKLFLS